MHAMNCDGWRIAAYVGFNFSLMLPKFYAMELTPWLVTYCSTENNVFMMDKTTTRLVHVVKIEQYTNIFVFYSRLNEADEEITELKQADPMLRRELEVCMLVSQQSYILHFNIMYLISNISAYIERDGITWVVSM